MKKISVLIANRHATSITLEPEFIEALKEIATQKKQSLNQIITEIDKNRQVRNLSSAIRVYVLENIKKVN